MNTWCKRGRTKKQVNKRRVQESLPRTLLAETQQTIFFFFCLFFLLQSKNTIKTVSLNNNQPHRAGMKQRHWGEMKRNKAGFFFCWNIHIIHSNLQPFTTRCQPRPCIASVCHVAHIYKQRGGASQKRWGGKSVEVLAPRRRGTTGSCEWRRNHLQPPSQQSSCFSPADFPDVREKNLTESSPAPPACSPS